ncbi:hypothetical protein BD410DRAFT_335432 [Rickenella mellea]|uniref:Uncharacterized protein n=1 Tax=Rickenella mellea TaxID=50990 RepID=A0A4Y7QJR9_9AGAM|nr:hypothetical protein BD410DRAFT_335432 [Rickenella mellea]
MCYTIGEQLTRNRAVLNPNGDWLGPHIAHILVTVDHSPLLVTGNTQFQSTEPPPPPPHQYALSTSIPYSASRDAITQTRQMSFQQNHGQIEEFWRLQSDLNKERPPGRFPPGMCGENQALQSLYLANGPLYAFGAALVINNHDFMDQDLFPSVAATKANARVAFGPCQTCQNLYRFANVIFYDIATGWVYGPPPPPDRPLGPAWKLFHKCQLYNCMNDCQKCDRSKVFRCPKGCVASWCDKSHFKADKKHASNCYAEPSTPPETGHPQSGRYQSENPPLLAQTVSSLPPELQNRYPTHYNVTHYPTRHYANGAGPSGTR